MVQITIRCHARVPAAAAELERWLNQQVGRLRSEVPHGTVRLTRDGIDTGWLLELALPEGEPSLAPGRLTEVLTDMRLLGLQPTLLEPGNA